MHLNSVEMVSHDHWRKEKCYHYFHSCPSWGAPVHGHALVYHVGHGSDNLCGDKNSQILLAAFWKKNVKMELFMQKALKSSAKCINVNYNTLSINCTCN